MKTRLEFYSHMFESRVLRRALSLAIAVAIALFVERYYAQVQEFWIPLTTIFVMQLTLRTDARQAFLRFIVVLCSIFTLSLLKQFIVNSFLANSIFVGIFVVVIFLHYWQERTLSPLYTFSLVGILALLMLAPFSPAINIFARLHDVTLGGGIGILATLLIFPLREDVEFRNGIIPVFKAFRDYLFAIQNLILTPASSEGIATAKKYRLEAIMQNSIFPEWVYEMGFNPILREGHRHFLLCTEQIAEVLFAMHHVVRHQFAPDLITDLMPVIIVCFDRTAKIMDAVISRLELNKLDTSVIDFVDDILALRKKVNELVTQPLDFVEGSQDYIMLAGLIYDFKDLQRLLLKLAEALRDN